ncbi:MAG: neuraminidase (sialidase) [Ruminococcaceae bacterium]|nr:neuraminidase (sialidase) [Oscillospiraceae bacterium]
MKILANEFVLPLKAGRSCHASSFIVLQDGGIYAVYFCGTGEGHDDVRIFGSMREPGVVGHWSEPTPITPDDGIPHWNPVLLPLDDGTVILYYKVGKRIPTWQTYYCVSTDGCKTWSEPVEMVPGNIGGRGPVRNKCVTLSDGAILAPGSTELDDWRCFFDRSSDNGKTWERSEDVLIPGDCVFRRGIIQPTIWEDKTGVHALLRSSEGYIFRTDSSDLGRTWCTAYATALPNNNSGIDLAQTDDGRLILAYNPVCGNWAERTPLSLAVSNDSGETWELLTHVITENLPHGFSYPAIRYENGKIHLTYTWNRETIAYLCLEIG